MKRWLTCSCIFLLALLGLCVIIAGAAVVIPMHYVSQGDSFYDQEKYEVATEKYTLAINWAFVPTFKARAYERRGLAHLKRDECLDATSDFAKAIDYAPESASAYSNRGLALDCQEQYEKAIDDYTKAIELAPDLSEPYVGRGDAYAEIGMYERALKDFDAAIERASDEETTQWAQSHKLITEADIELEDCIGALEDGLDALDRASWAEDAQTGLAHIEKAKRDFQTVESKLTSARGKLDIVAELTLLPEWYQVYISKEQDVLATTYAAFQPCDEVLDYAESVMKATRYVEEMMEAEDALWLIETHYNRWEAHMDRGEYSQAHQSVEAMRQALYPMKDATRAAYQEADIRMFSVLDEILDNYLRFCDLMDAMTDAVAGNNQTLFEQLLTDFTELDAEMTTLLARLEYAELDFEKWWADKIDPLWLDSMASLEEAERLADEAEHYYEEHKHRGWPLKLRGK